MMWLMSELMSQMMDLVTGHHISQCCVESCQDVTWCLLFIYKCITIPEKENKAMNVEHVCLNYDFIFKYMYMVLIAVYKDYK